MEIEKKFRIEDAEILNKLTRLAHLGAYTLRHSDHPEQQHNTYYDTPDRLLQSKRYGLRIRTSDGRSIATLKGPGSGQEGLFERGEWEIEAHDPNPATWPESTARAQALALLGDATLIPLLIIHTQRRHIIAQRGEQEVAELSLDEGSIEAGEHSETFCELEIELLPAGTSADIESLEAALRQHIPLVAENRSKLERGIALLNRSL